MRSLVAIAAVALMTFANAHAGTFGKGIELKAGEPFPEVKFEKLMTTEGYKNLGVGEKAGGAFAISDIGGEILILEFFNRFCLSCIDQVPHLNALFEAIEKGEFSKDVRILAIGAGNGEAGVSKFMEKEGPKYPLTIDPEMELFFSVGDPEGTPLSFILTKDHSGKWLTADAHIGTMTARELKRKLKAIMEGKKVPEELDVTIPSHRDAPKEKVGNPIDHATELFAGIVGEGATARKLEIDYPWTVFQGVDSKGGAVDLFVIVASRYPICDLCHESVFAIAFTRAGIIKGFKPVYVTRYGNKEWLEEDAKFMARKLKGRSIKIFNLDPEVDAVSGATISTTVIFDEVKKTAKLLGMLPE